MENHLAKLHAWRSRWRSLYAEVVDISVITHLPLCLLLPSDQGSKPVWNQRFSFYIDDQATELQIKILNHNYLTEDDEIGSTT